jgi:hypothetical protein
VGLLRQARYAEAEPLIVPGYDGMRADSQSHVVMYTTSNSIATLISAAP